MEDGALIGLSGDLRAVLHEDAVGDRADQQQDAADHEHQRVGVRRGQNGAGDDRRDGRTDEATEVLDRTQRGDVVRLRG